MPDDALLGAYAAVEDHLAELVGPPGEPGKDGIDGRDGTNGAEGKAGLDGIGIPGADGVRGPRGYKGEKGDKGDKGDPGTDGVDGKDGKDGKDAAIPIMRGQQVVRGGGIAGVTVKSAGTPVGTPNTITTLNYTGGGVTYAGGNAVDIAGGGGGGSLTVAGDIGQAEDVTDLTVSGAGGATTAVIQPGGPGTSAQVTVTAGSGGFDYTQVADPGAVGAGKTWLVLPDTLLDQAGVGLNVRNAANDGWLSVGAIVPLTTDYFAQYLASNGGISLNIRSRSANFDAVSTQLSPISGWLQEVASQRAPEGQLVFHDGKFHIGQEFGPASNKPFIATGPDPNAVATPQVAFLQAQGVWTGGSVTISDGFGPYEIGVINWDDSDSDIETMLNDYWGDPAFTVTGGSLPADILTITFTDPTGINIFFAVTSNDLIGTDPTLAIDFDTWAYLPPTATDGSLFLGTDPPALYRGVGSVWVKIGQAAFVEPTAATPEAIANSLITAGLMAAS